MPIGPKRCRASYAFLEETLFAEQLVPLYQIDNSPVDATPPTPGIVRLRQLSSTTVGVSFVGFLDEETEVRQFVLPRSQPRP